MMTVHSIVLFLLLVLTLACGKKECDGMARLDGRDPMLIVGDSISIGYTPFVREANTNLQVIHNTCNAESSDNGVKKISSWAGHAPRWKVCAINHGIWDTREVPIERYVTNLETEISVLNAACEKVMFVTTTNITTAQKDKVPEYNRAATELMERLKVPVCDLNTTSLKMLPALIDGIHYTPKGYRELGNTVSNCISSL